MSYAFSFDVIFLNSSRHLVFKLVCIHPCVHGLHTCALHYIIVTVIQNKMEQKKIYICIGDENMVKCATVRPLIYSVFISQ